VRLFPLVLGFARGTSGAIAPRFRKPLRFDGLFRNPDFVKLWAAETVSIFGSMISQTALPFTAVLALQAMTYHLKADAGLGA